jgi:glycosyltransferase involved in cell wall biosynthesis
MSSAALKLVLVGPYPPPHGGISVHVATAQRLLSEAGVDCRVIDVTRPEADAGPGRGRRRGWRAGWALAGEVRRYARGGFTPHVHANGHSARSWLQVLGCGIAGRRAPARLLTLHSGMLPRHLADGGAAARGLARLALARYDRVLCVNEEIRDSLRTLGVPAARLEVAPAYLPAPRARRELPDLLRGWIDGHRPLVSTALFFRPEYGFELLVEALRDVRAAHPRLGCLVLGDGEGSAAGARALARAGAREWVLLAGDVPHPLCLALIARSDLFVRPALADGDAISVREALALAVPVVASDAGPRPEGVVRFRSGDAGDLARRIAGALGAPRPRAAAAEPVAERRALERLLAFYREASREGEACVRRW